MISVSYSTEMPIMMSFSMQEVLRILKKFLIGFVIRVQRTCYSLFFHHKIWEKLKNEEIAIWRQRKVIASGNWQGVMTSHNNFLWYSNSHGTRNSRYSRFKTRRSRELVISNSSLLRQTWFVFNKLIVRHYRNHGSHSLCCFGRWRSISRRGLYTNDFCAFSEIQISNFSKI